ncbi:TerB family tellurite resistance protein [Zavarzinia sp. CC-PAN008]|uniref:TerB family tellurite resistance protein n=1 Tax=Zavarzinia sp. CC-PAN008 TaxID=3243332 RepID=UPI003F74776D
MPRERGTMELWGKLIGSAAGLALGGPVGFLLGGLAGHAFDVIRDDCLHHHDAVGAPEGEDGEAPRPEHGIAFTIGVIALSAKMARADGEVTRDEVAAFRDIFEVPPHEARNVERVFDLAKQDTLGWDSYAAQLGRLFRGRPAVLEDLLDGLFHIAKADGHVTAAELAYLEGVARAFHFTADDFARIREAHLGADEADPYVVLGVARDISDEALRKAWKALVRRHHPDALIAQGLPPEMIAVSGQRLAAINAAFDHIVRLRGIARVPSPA